MQHQIIERLLKKNHNYNTQYYFIKYRLLVSLRHLKDPVQLIIEDVAVLPLLLPEVLPTQTHR